MDRRNLLKVLSLAGVGSVAAGLSCWRAGQARPSYFLVTEAPTADAARLMRLAGCSQTTSLNIAPSPIQPAAQDLALLYDGRLVDPTQDPGIPPPLADFARTLRARPGQGHVLLTLAPAPPPGDDVITFAYDGFVYDRIRRHATYRRIEMPGARGPTIFRLEGGALSVTASSCRHALCKKMGARSTGSIVCAPNKLVATLPGAPGLLDAVTG